MDIYLRIALSFSITSILAICGIAWQLYCMMVRLDECATNDHHVIHKNMLNALEQMESALKAHAKVLGLHDKALNELQTLKIRKREPNNETKQQ